MAFSTITFALLAVSFSCAYCEWTTPYANITFQPLEIDDLIEKIQIRQISLNYSWEAANLNEIYLTVESMDPGVVEVHGNSTIKLDSSNVYTNNTYFQVKGIFLGKTYLQCTLKSNNVPTESSNVVTKYKIGVIREPSVLDTIFIATVSTMVALNTIGFGCKMDLQVVKEIFKKPFAPIIGFICQYGLMPTLAYALGKIVGLPPELAFGLFVIGASPGGGASNVWTILLGGDINLSLTMTFLSTVASLGFLPLWVYTLGVTLLDTDIKIPFENIATSLVTLVVPCIIGLLIRRYLPKVADFLSKLIRPFSLVIVLFIISFGTYTNLYIFYMLADWRILVSALLLPYTGFVISGLVAVICRQPWYRIKTIIFETGVQNTGVAILLLKLSLPQPESDLSVAMPVSATLFCPFPLLFCFIGRTIYRRCCRKDEGDISEGKDGIERQNSEYPLQLSDELANEYNGSINAAVQSKEDLTKDDNTI